MADLILQDELELTMVGTLLLDGRLIGETLSILTPADFTGLGARTLYGALGKLFLSGKPTDQLSVLLEAGEDCQSVVDLILDRHLWTTGEGLAHYREQLRQASRLRQIHELGRQLSETASLSGAEGLLARLNGAMAARQDTRVMSMQDAMVDFISRLDQTPEYIKWGMPKLDEKLYTEPGDFVILGGYSSSGKTLLALQFALGMAQRYRVGFFSLETGHRKITDRTVVNHTQIAMDKLKRRTLAEQDYDLIAASASALSKLDLTLVDASGMSVTDIQAVTLQHRFQIIFVDYLQIVRAPGADLRQQVTRISIDLHTMAQTHGVTVIALAQLSRPEKTKSKPTPPNVQSLRESSQLENDADVVMLLYPKDPDDNGSNRILKVGKNKEGEKLTMELAFHGATQTFTPVAGDKEVAKKLIHDGKRAKRQSRQTAIDGFSPADEPEFVFEETEEEVPF